MNRLINVIQDLSKPFQDADFLPNILGKYNREAVLGHIQVVLFGAGSAGVHLCRALKIHHVNITCFCDNNPKIIGGFCAGHPVISVEELRKDHQKSLIVISVSQPYAQQIRDQLLNLGFTSDSIHTPPPDPLLYYTNAAKLYWSPADLQTRAQQLQDTCDLFLDQKSKDLFIHRIALLTGGLDYNSYWRFIQLFADLISDLNPNLFLSPLYDENYFYFNSDFFPVGNKEVFANVGALVGDCAIEFAKACKTKGLQYKEIINFEPDHNNFVQLSANMNHLANVRCLPYGLWSHRSHLRFSNPDKYNACTPGSLDPEGNLEVEVISLDELLPDVEISFMKMDVEGAELEALCGASNTIKRNRPKLAISVYHKRDDIFEIPLFIHQLHPGYRFYLRHHSTTFGETVLFAVP
ncbi:MAG: FkbM family methyltransferase [Syntrophobacteraceae bacterium]